MGMEHERSAKSYDQHPLYFVTMCVFRIHLETSSVLIRQLPIDHVQKPTNWTYAPPQIC